MAHPTNCTCCNGLSTQTPVLVTNRPGLQAIAYRVGTHPQFKQSLLARLATSDSALRSLTTRHDDDFTIGLLDAWSTVADVLTFYQERIANESYLRTATERYSVLEMARLIGYQLQPGVAASTYLAFTIDDSPSAFTPQLIPGTAHSGQVEAPIVTISPKTRVQSVPGPGEEPQTFETVEAIDARADWNAIRPRLTQPQQLAVDMKALLLQGTAYSLKKGDVMLINKTKLRRILNVTLDETARTTRVDFVAESSFTAQAAPAQRPGRIASFRSTVAFTAGTVQELRNVAWRESDLTALTLIKRWSAGALAISLAYPRPSPKTTPEHGAYIFRKRAFFFGYNAPMEVMYPPNQPPKPSEWKAVESPSQIFLDAAYEEVMPESVIAIQGPDEKLENVKKIIDVRHVELRSRTGYGISSKTTVLTVDGDWRQLIGGLDFLDKLRDLTIYAQNEPVTLAEVPIDELVEKDTIALDRYYPGLRPGQKLILIGTRSDLPGVVTSEVLTLDEVTIEEGLTVIKLDHALTNTYIRDSVTMNGNVALATHGETVQESLGSGDASRLFQRFTLRQPPLTYVSGSSASGTTTTLEIRVNEVRWHEVTSLLDCGPQDHVYVTHLDDTGKTTVLFGDGITGARLPTGQDNVKAIYRKGIGLGGQVKANQLSQLISRPLGVKGVNNPIEARGAADRESIDDARRNAPLPVLTLGRVVSLQDYADFARSFAGIAKATATWTWLGQQRGIFLTVAGAKGDTVDSSDPLYTKLLKAIRQASDPNVALQLVSYAPVFFQIAANVQVDADYLPEKVLPAVETGLRQQFSFAAREFGQPVAYSEVIAAIQRVPGVVAVELDAFFRSDEDTPGLITDYPRLLEASVPRPGAAAPLPAELLTLDPRPVVLRTML